MQVILKGMYTPRQLTASSATIRQMAYREFKPAPLVQDLVHCFWTLRSLKACQQPVTYTALPDACVDIIFDVSPNPEFTGALITTPSTSASMFTLKPPFLYVGIRCQPGAWQDAPDAIVGQSLFAQTLGSCDLEEVQQQLADASSEQQLLILEELVSALERAAVLIANSFIQVVLRRLDQVNSVQELASNLGYSLRHTQRVLQAQTGYRPHDFLKIIRFQQALGDRQTVNYADQSHFIRECKRITGLTPRQLQSLYR